MDELRELEHEISVMREIPSWEWDEELEKALEKLTKRKLEILYGKEEA